MDELVLSATRGGPRLRRQATAPVAVAFEEPAVPEAPPVETPSEAPAAPGMSVAEMALASPRSQALGVGTPVLMIGGVHLGLSGIVTSVQSRATQNAVDAIYTLILDDGKDGSMRVFVKQSSLGRVWVRSGE